jgi:hypothetical protein
MTNRIYSTRDLEDLGIKTYSEWCNATYDTVDSIDQIYKDFIKGSFSESDRFIFLNNNILILESAKNIFDMVPPDKIGLTSLNEPHSLDVVVFSYQHLAQGFLSTHLTASQQLQKFQDQIYKLSYKFNRTPELDGKTGEHRLKSYFINYNPLQNLMPPEAINNIIKQDIADYKNDNYFKNFNIAIRVDGGLGDLVAAEPTVRYMCEHLYKDDNVIIVTYAPELFAHINRPKYLPTDMVPDASSYYITYTLPPQDHISKFVVSPLLVHACNYASICAIRAELPVGHKQIKLPLKWDSNAFAVLKLGRQDFENMVLVHMGISWPSKTIPEDVWQTYIDAIKETGKTPVLIGKDQSEDRGVAKNIDTAGCIDLRNKLELMELVAIVSKIPVLISNDSLPIHIAGAFDNYIGLIATAKNADYILPYRNEDIYYKAKDLSKFKFYKTYESRPNYLEGSRVDMVDPVELRKCLPDPEDIKVFIQECFKNITLTDLQSKKVVIESLNEGE